MSDAVNPPPISGDALPPPPRNGCLTAFMFLAGIILLLPGLCALIFGGMALSQPNFDSGFVPFVVFGLLVGFGGVMLIRAAIRGPQS
jgi:hypothetical protein